MNNNNNNNDGVIKTEFVLRTRDGREYKMVHFKSPEEVRDDLVSTLENKKPFVFPYQDENGRTCEKIIPWELILDIDIAPFQQVTVMKSKITKPGVR